MIDVAVARQHADDCPADDCRDDTRPDKMRQKFYAGVTEGRAENQLHPHASGRECGESWSAGCEVALGKRMFVLQPSAAGEQGHRNDDAEDHLSQRGMRGGDGPRQQVQDRDTAKDPLAYDGRQRSPAEDTHPFSGFDTLRPYGHDNDKQADELGNHAVSVLVLHSTDHGRKFVKRTEGGWPIRDR